MPRGSNPNSKANLIVNSERTPKQRKAQAVKAGKKSGEVRAAFKSLCDTVKEQCTNEDRQEIAKMLVRMARHGNLGAVDRLLKMFGEDPALKIEVSGSINIADMLREAQERENMVIDDAEAVDGDAE